MHQDHDVRNAKSLAHDNPISHHNEAPLILGLVGALVRFIHALEGRMAGASR